MVERTHRMPTEAVRLMCASMRGSAGIRRESLEGGIETGGRTGKKLDEIIDRVNKAMLDKEMENPEVIQKMRLRLGVYLGRIPEEEVREAYEKGLELTVKQRYRLGRKIKTDLFADGQIDDAISAYTIGFYLSLRASERLGTLPRTALRLAQQLHNLGPFATLQLSKTHPELQRSTVEYLAFNNSKDPGSAIDRFIEVVSRLSEAHPELPRSTVEYFALHKLKDPESAIIRFIDAVSRLSEAHPELPRSTVEYFALNNPKDPESAIDRFIDAVSGLSEAHPELPRGTVERIALHNPKDPGSAIDRFIDAVSGLSEAYPELPRGTVERIALHNPKDPESAIIRFLASKGLMR